ncbi:MAG: hypothetical protein ACKV19_23980 [Verrucomicrobiales bacterium]
MVTPSIHPAPSQGANYSLLRRPSIVHAGEAWSVGSAGHGARRFWQPIDSGRGAPPNANTCFGNGSLPENGLAVQNASKYGVLRIRSFGPLSH